jgi:hypothetical protein
VARALTQLGGALGEPVLLGGARLDHARVSGLDEELALGGETGLQQAGALDLGVEDDADE